MINHPILDQSFAIIDREINSHNFTPSEYAIVRRAIHATADFGFLELFRFSPTAITSAIAAIHRKTPIITDVTMVKQGIATLVSKTFQNPLIAAIERVNKFEKDKTRTEVGILNCFEQYPEAIYVIGNAPTALIALCERVSQSKGKPALIVGVPVGFVSVVESKNVLSRLEIPQICIEGRKGGSPVAAAIVNALIVLAWENKEC